MAKIEIKKRTIKVFNHNTSISLENEFWQGLKLIAEEQNLSLTALIEKIDLKRVGNLSSTIRVFVLNYFINKKL